MDAEQHLLRNAYAAFNARDLDAALALLDPDVEWPDAVAGGHLQGREAVRRYWSRQWAKIDPHVEPQSFATDEHGRAVAEVREVVLDLHGNHLADRVVRHAFRIEGGLIRRMDVLPPMPAD